MKIMLLILALLLSTYLTREKALSSRRLITEQNSYLKLNQLYQYSTVIYTPAETVQNLVA